MQLYELSDIMGDKPRPLPCVAFAVVVFPVIQSPRIERRTPRTVLHFPLHEAGRFIEVILVIFSFQAVFCIFGFFAQRPCELGNAPVVVGVFESFGDSLYVEVAGDVGQRIFIEFADRHYDIGIESVFAVFNGEIMITGCLHTCFERLLCIKIPGAFHISFRDDRYCMIADHRSRVI